MDYALSRGRVPASGAFSGILLDGHARHEAVLQKAGGELRDSVNLKRRDAFGSGPGDVRLDVVEEDHAVGWNLKTRQRFAIDSWFRLVATELVG